MKITNIYQKTLPSLINTLTVLILSIPLLFIKIPDLDKKFIVIGIFFIYSFVFLILNKNRDLGMILMKTDWKINYPPWQHFIYIILYTTSFSTLFFWIKFPFDLFIANLLLLQLPAVLLTNTTFHGFLSGKMTTTIKG